jgi:hypothetical protein
MQLMPYPGMFFVYAREQPEWNKEQAILQAEDMCGVSGL